MTYYGNTSLLDLHAHGFLCSRSTKSSVILPCLDWAVEHAHGSNPVMSTFHSEMEDAVLDMLIPGTCPIILVLGRRLYCELPKKLLPLKDSDRLLMVSVADQERISRKSALLCNQFICEKAIDLTFGFLSPESSLIPLQQEALKHHKSVTVITQL